MLKPNELLLPGSEKNIAGRLWNRLEIDIHIGPTQLLTPAA